jgi:hypothetical protein
VSKAEQNAYRRWLAKQRGWRGIKGPGNPPCRGIKTQPPGKGEPCSRSAMDGGEYCASHDPELAAEREAHLVQVRLRQPQKPQVALAPFARWLCERRRELGSWAAVAERLGRSTSLIHCYARGLDGNKRPKQTIGRDTVDQLLFEDGTTTVEELYGSDSSAEHELEAVAA